MFKSTADHKHSVRRPVIRASLVGIAGVLLAALATVPAAADPADAGTDPIVTPSPANWGWE